MKIREMTPEDWPEVRRIYKAGIDAGLSTFQTEVPSWEVWNAGHRELCRLVAVIDGKVAGWGALSPTSSRACYAGVNEVSLYVAPEARGHGVGTTLLRELIDRSEEAGVWQLYGSVFDTNEASLRMCEKAGFRRVGTREAIAKNKDGVWQNTVIVERRSPKIW
ncbi:MAG TPA: GNAT family N-acetyltransferase [Candidatus Acidoferrum sp.]|nr:GNAT family N-acetyltransferase [Candidatus Acidoferrum sp.]